MNVKDQRILDACKGVDLDPETATPLQLVRAYAQWTLGDAQWAEVFVSVIKSAGYKIS